MIEIKDGSVECVSNSDSFFMFPFLKVYGNVYEMEIEKEKEKDSFVLNNIDTDIKDTDLESEGIGGGFLVKRTGSEVELSHLINNIDNNKDSKRMQIEVNKEMQTDLNESSIIRVINNLLILYKEGGTHLEYYLLSFTNRNSDNSTRNTDNKSIKMESRRMVLDAEISVAMNSDFDLQRVVDVEVRGRDVCVEYGDGSKEVWRFISDTFDSNIIGEEKESAGNMDSDVCNDSGDSIDFGSCESDTNKDGDRESSIKVESSAQISLGMKNKEGSKEKGEKDQEIVKGITDSDCALDLLGGLSVSSVGSFNNNVGMFDKVSAESLKSSRSNKAGSMKSSTENTSTLNSEVNSSKVSKTVETDIDILKELLSSSNIPLNDSKQFDEVYKDIRKEFLNIKKVSKHISENISVKSIKYEGVDSRDVMSRVYRLILVNKGYKQKIEGLRNKDIDTNIDLEEGMQSLSITNKNEQSPLKTEVSRSVETELNDIDTRILKYLRSLETNSPVNKVLNKDGEVKVYKASELGTSHFIEGGGEDSYSSLRGECVYVRRAVSGSGRGVGYSFSDSADTGADKVGDISKGDTNKDALSGLSKEKGGLSTPLSSFSTPSTVSAPSGSFGTANTFSTANKTAGASNSFSTASKPSTSNTFSTASGLSTPSSNNTTASKPSTFSTATSGFGTTGTSNSNTFSTPSTANTANNNTFNSFNKPGNSSFASTNSFGNNNMSNSSTSKPSFTLNTNTSTNNSSTNIGSMGGWGQGLQTKSASLSSIFNTNNNNNTGNVNNNSMSNNNMGNKSSSFINNSPEDELLRQLERDLNNK